MVKYKQLETSANPIIFTSAEAVGSRNPGDWGGIIICGKAPINLPGGIGTNQKVVPMLFTVELMHLTILVHYNMYVLSMQEFLSTKPRNQWPNTWWRW